MRIEWESVFEIKSIHKKQCVSKDEGNDETFQERTCTASWSHVLIQEKLFNNTKEGEWDSWSPFTERECGLLFWGFFLSKKTLHTTNQGWRWQRETASLIPWFSHISCNWRRCERERTVLSWTHWPLLKRKMRWRRRSKRGKHECICKKKVTAMIIKTSLTRRVNGERGMTWGHLVSEILKGDSRECPKSPSHLSCSISAFSPSSLGNEREMNSSRHRRRLLSVVCDTTSMIRRTRKEGASLFHLFTAKNCPDWTVLFLSHRHSFLAVIRVDGRFKDRESRWEDKR